MALRDMSWESKRWTLLASFLVLAGLWLVTWWLIGGCDWTMGRGGPAPSSPGEALPADEANVAILQAMNDTRVKDLSFQVACFQSEKGRLPSFEEVAERQAASSSWPKVTAQGAPIVYRPKDGLAYELILPGSDGEAATDDDVVIPQQVPESMPKELSPDARRAWWDLQYLQSMTEVMQRSLKAMMRGERKPPE